MPDLEIAHALYQSLEDIPCSPDFLAEMRQKGIADSDIYGALENNLMARRVMEQSDLARVLVTFGRKRNLFDLPSGFKPYDGYIEGENKKLHSINMLTLYWQSPQGLIGNQAIRQASLVIIDAKKIGGYVGAKVGGATADETVAKNAEKSAVDLPVSPSYYDITKEMAHRIRQAGLGILERLNHTVDVISDPAKRVVLYDEKALSHLPLGFSDN